MSVIVVNWNGKKLLFDCLESLRRQAYQPLSVICVDNGSRDGSVDFLHQYYPEVKTLALSENLGFSAANNYALKFTSSKYVALLNNDAVADKFWITHLVQALASHPEAGFAASKMLFRDKPDVIDRAGEAYTRAGTGLLRGRGAKASDFAKKEWIFGACAGAAIYRTSMLNDIGFFDEDFFLLYEDVDLSFRAQLRGYKCLYVPDAIVYHKASSSIVYDSPISVYYSHRNLEWVYLKNMPSKLIIKTMWLHLLYDAAAFVFFSLHGKMKPFLRAKWDAVQGTKNMLKKRRLIQNMRTVDDDYLWALLEKERFFPRLSRRLRKK
ncbi:MAG: glycosyltransferase family 2 protein [Thermodesulfobacteriota bacterium]